MSELASVHSQVERLVDIKRYADARRLLARALQQNPDDVESLYLAGRVELESDDRAKARGFVSDALARAPEHHGARLLLFRIQLEERAYPQAEEVILGLLREFPQDGNLYALYARLMLETLHLEKARALLDESLRLEPEAPLGRCLDILLRVIEGEERDAEQRLGRLVAEDPEAYHVAWICISVFTSRGRYRDAFAIARELLKVNPNDRELIDTLVQLRVQSHWSMLPLWPFARFGWGGSAVIWVLAVGASTLVRRFASPEAAGSVAIVCMAYILYSWIWPPLLRRWLLWRGF